MVQDCHEFPAYLQWLIEFIGDDVIVAHNAPFDIGFLKRYCDDCQVEFNNKVACTLQGAKAAIKGLPNYKLQTVAAHIGAVSEKHHRAYGDALATANILIYILNATETKARHTEETISHDNNGGVACP
jgi:DNA polymerase-3 subunit alpha (Gram-positive type)